MIKLCSFFLFMALGCGSISAADTSHLGAPEIPVEQALALAKRHVCSEKLDVSESYIALKDEYEASSFLDRVKSGVFKSGGGRPYLLAAYPRGQGQSLEDGLRRYAPPSVNVRSERLVVFDFKTDRDYYANA